jgi:hypothetical protein
MNPVLQPQLRDADVKTLRVYPHAIPESQRGAMKRITLDYAEVPIGTAGES